MGERHAHVFESLRAHILERLVEVRASIDEAFSRVPEHVVREQFAVVIGKLHHYLLTEDAEAFRSFASRWVAMRVGELPPEKLIQVVVAIGDVTDQIAHRMFAGRPDLAELSFAVSRMTFAGARVLVEVLAGELDRQVARYQSIRGQTP